MSFMPDRPFFLFVPLSLPAQKLKAEIASFPRRLPGRVRRYYHDKVTDEIDSNCSRREDILLGFGKYGLWVCFGGLRVATPPYLLHMCTLMSSRWWSAMGGRRLWVAVVRGRKRKIDGSGPSSINMINAA